MDKLLVKNGLLVDKQNGYHQEKKDILIEKGIILEIGDHLDFDCPVYNGEGYFVSPGFIDVHVHENKPPESYANPDIIGTRRGASAIIECGSVWVDGAEDFVSRANNYDTKWFALLSGHNEYNGNSNEVDIHGTKETHYLTLFHRYPQIFKGIKCVCSNRRSNLLGYPAVKKMKGIAEKAGVPLTVHVGAYPPDPCGLVEFLEKGDVMTHVYHGKEISLFHEDGEAKIGFQLARQRGVLFDIGHGTDSFNYFVFDKAMKNGFYPDLISTDIRKSNADGPVYSLDAVMSKALPYMPLEDVVHCVTYRAASAYNLGKMGQLKKGFIADLSVFTVDQGEYAIADSNGNQQPLSKLINTKDVIVSRGANTKIIPCDLGYMKNGTSGS